MIGKGTKIYRPELSNLGDFTCGEECTIHSPVWIGDGVVLGDRVKVQGLAFIPSGVEVGDDVFIGPGVVFTNDPFLNIVPRGEFIPTKTKVGSGAKFGANSTILAGVSIGKGSIIGMGAVVLHDIPDNEVWIGNPARKME